MYGIEVDTDIPFSKGHHALIHNVCGEEGCIFTTDDGHLNGPKTLGCNHLNFLANKTFLL
jgi:hypothetical protein